MVLPEGDAKPAEALSGAIKPAGHVGNLVIPGAPRAGLTADEAVRGWQEDRNRLRRALDIAITWLYRRQNWAGLSPDGKDVEPAPDEIWAKQKYDQLGQQNVPYEPPSPVMVEPGWKPPRDFSPQEREAAEAVLEEMDYAMERFEYDWGRGYVKAGDDARSAATRAKRKALVITDTTIRQKVSVFADQLFRIPRGWVEEGGASQEQLDDLRRIHDDAVEAVGPLLRARG